MVELGMTATPTVPTRALVLAAIGADGELDAGPLFSMSAALGHSDKAMRDALARVVSDGFLTHRSGRGKKAIYNSTPKGLAALDIDLAWAGFAHRVDTGLQKWNKKWHLIGFEIPETRRGARDALRNLLLEMGAVPLQSGMYIHAYDLAGFVDPIAQRLGVVDQVNYLTATEIRVGPLSESTEIARELWNLDARSKRFDQLTDVLLKIIERASVIETDKLAAEMFAAMVLAEQVHREDPLLPIALLPEKWSGVKARQAFLTAHEEVTRRSSTYRNSHMGTALVSEIEAARTESAKSFWGRWGPRLLAAYLGRLPKSAKS